MFTVYNLLLVAVAVAIRDAQEWCSHAATASTKALCRMCPWFFRSFASRASAFQQGGWRGQGHTLMLDCVPEA